MMMFIIFIEVMFAVRESIVNRPYLTKQKKKKKKNADDGRTETETAEEERN